MGHLLFCQCGLAACARYCGRKTAPLLLSCGVLLEASAGLSCNLAALLNGRYSALLATARVTAWQRWASCSLLITKGGIK